MTGGAAEEAIWGHPLVARALRIWRRLRRGDRERPWAADALLVAVVLLVFCLPDLRHGSHQAPGDRVDRLPLTMALGLQFALALPLLWRRRRPTAVFAAISAVFVAQWAWNVWLHADIAFFVALYSVARHAPLRRLPWVAAGTAAALGLVAFRVSVVLSPLVALFFLYSAATAAAVLGLALRIGTAYLEALRERAARLEVERDQRSRLAAAAERTRVAREMHDIIGHNLAVIIGLADGGSYAAAVAPEHSREALRLIAGTGRQALDELRRMLGVLREERPQGPEYSPQPGLADLDELCARVRAAGPAVTYRTVGDVDALDRGRQLAVYRIVQEALTNTLKHAGSSTRAQLTVAVEGDGVLVRVEDSGRPPGRAEPGAARPPQGEGQGIAGMRERAALYGGSVTVARRPGGGWVVEALLDRAPLAGAAP
ncbi:sensor histidine kinase [Streptacidiphilus sp. P02-A3a]|uniref:sensor histidine kinase n=1 Tax=Streptacidiphilus sp. P02-A3a TaxID=2704468 RepID=UPI0015FBE394|nr:histidine kinase [Streptacidiphilus sp. P02-A3a]QMU74052.1 sensor histidine kinase [Streptacidiphilus sp. P02-A3a]